MYAHWRLTPLYYSKWLPGVGGSMCSVVDVGQGWSYVLYSPNVPLKIVSWVSCWGCWEDSTCRANFTTSCDKGIYWGIEAGQGCVPCMQSVAFTTISVATRIHFAVIYTHVNWGMYIVYQELLFGAVPNFWLRAHGNWLGSRPFCFFFFDVWSFVAATATPSPVALQYCLFLLSFINFIGFRRIQAGLVRGA